MTDPWLSRELRRQAREIVVHAVLAAAEASGTALEVNGSLPRLDLSVDWLRRARASDVVLVLTSDAHHADELDRLRFAALNAERAWVEPARVANAWTAERLHAWVRAKAPRT